jgi:hypothetical protein
MRVVVSGWPLSWVGVGGIGGGEMRRDACMRLKRRGWFRALLLVPFHFSLIPFHFRDCPFVVEGSSLPWVAWRRRLVHCGRPQGGRRRQVAALHGVRGMAAPSRV